MQEEEGAVFAILPDFPPPPIWVELAVVDTIAADTIGMEEDSMLLLLPLRMLSPHDAREFKFAPL